MSAFFIGDLVLPINKLTPEIVVSVEHPLWLKTINLQTQESFRHLVRDVQLLEHPVYKNVPLYTPGFTSRQKTNFTVSRDNDPNWIPIYIAMRQIARIWKRQATFTFGVLLEGAYQKRNIVEMYPMDDEKLLALLENNEPVWLGEEEEHKNTARENPLRLHNIEKFISTLESYWKQNDTMRLAQLIYISLDKPFDRNTLLMISDTELLNSVRQFVEKKAS